MIGTKIEWATDTVNFWWGCSKVSPACEHCYAEALDARFHPNPFQAHWGPENPRLLKVQSALRDIAKIRRRAIKTGERPRVFINSMSDFFEDRHDLDAPRLAALDAMRQAPEVDFLLLTKRPEKIRELIERAHRDARVVSKDLGNWRENRQQFEACADWMAEWINGAAPLNIWIGTTVENQEWADKRIPELLKVPAAVRFLSCEPMLGPVELPRHDQSMGRSFSPLDWVICGGESGPHSRPMHPDWARSLRDQCAAAGVPFHFKQWGEYLPEGQAPPDIDVREFGYCFPWEKVGLGGTAYKLGKQLAGRRLDGVEHNGFPEVKP